MIREVAWKQQTLPLGVEYREEVANEQESELLAGIPAEAVKLVLEQGVSRPTAGQTDHIELTYLRQGEVTFQVCSRRTRMAVVLIP